MSIKHKNFIDLQLFAEEPCAFATTWYLDGVAKHTETIYADANTGTGFDVTTAVSGSTVTITIDGGTSASYTYDTTVASATNELVSDGGGTTYFDLSVYAISATTTKTVTFNIPDYANLSDGDHKVSILTVNYTDNRMSVPSDEVTFTKSNSDVIMYTLNADVDADDHVYVNLVEVTLPYTNLTYGDTIKVTSLVYSTLYVNDSAYTVPGYNGDYGAISYPLTKDINLRVGGSPSATVADGDDGCSWTIYLVDPDSKT